MILTAAEIASMRAEVVGTLLDMTCTIQRNVPPPADDYGQTGEGWTAHLTNVPCHYWETAEEEMVGTANALVTRERLVLQANTDVEAGDRVLSVIGVDAVQVAGVMNILEVIQEIDATVLVVRAIL